jgi:hypothetical protein
LEKDMTFRRIILVLAMGAILMGLASTAFVWAAPEQNPARQTLPTKTPLGPPKEEKDKPTPVPTFLLPTSTPWTGTAMPIVTVVTPATPQTLPAGGSALSFPAGLTAAGILLTCAGCLVRLKTG